MKNECIYEIVSYSTESMILKFKENKIKINYLEKIDDYVYHISINPIYEKKILTLYKDARLIYSKGIFFIIKKRLIQKITLAAILISLVYFIFLENRLYKINIYGNNTRINSEITIVLNQNNIYKNMKIPDDLCIKKVKNIILDRFDEIESVDINVKGTILNLRYYLKEKENHHELVIGKYVASKNGVIAYGSIEKGNYLCYTNQYVKKGDILIDDYLYINDKKIYVGAYGKVYAYTWSIIELKINSSGYEDSELYSKLITDARYHIMIDFEENEKVVNEQILSFYNENGVGYLKVHYTLFENIAEIVK